MSVATEFPPEVTIPQRARETSRGPARPRHLCAVPAARADVAARTGIAGYPTALADVAQLHRRAARPAAVRLTHRGVLVLSALVTGVAVGLVGLAALSAPASPAAPAHVPDTVTVQAGDTLWSLAARLAPQRDPGAEVSDLQRWNHLAGAALVPGQVLRTH